MQQQLVEQVREAEPVSRNSFNRFCDELSMGRHWSGKFLEFVERAGGGGGTDHSTLQLLFEIWEEKGRP